MYFCVKTQNFTVASPLKSWFSSSVLIRSTVLSARLLGEADQILDFFLSASIFCISICVQPSSVPLHCSGCLLYLLLSVVDLQCKYKHGVNLLVFSTFPSPLPKGFGTLPLQWSLQVLEVAQLIIAASLQRAGALMELPCPGD